MSRRSQLILLATGLTATLLLIALYGLLTTPWLLWQLLPGTAPVRLSTHTTLATTAPVIDTLPAALSPVMPYTSRLAYARATANEQVLVVLPKLRYQATAAEVLLQNGWQVRRRGHLLQAWQGRVPPAPRLWPLFTQTSAKLLTSRGHGNPRLLLALPAQSADTDSLQLLATQHGNALQGTANTGSTNAPPVRHAAATWQETIPQATIAVPGEVLQKLPAPLRASLNQQLHRRLNFTHTQPDIVGELANQAQVALTITADDTVSITTTGNPLTIQAALQQWAQEEERRTRPVSEAFRLPDGTIGYEKVPGEPQPVFQADGLCYVPQDARTTLHICQQEGVVGISTTRDAAAQASAVAPHAQWELLLPASLIAELQARGCTQEPTIAATSPELALFCSLKELQLVSNGEVTSFLATIREGQ